MSLTRWMIKTGKEMYVRIFWYFNPLQKFVSCEQESLYPLLEWASTKQWNSRVLAYQRLGLSLLSRLAALSLLLQIQLEEGMPVDRFILCRNKLRGINLILLHWWKMNEPNLQTMHCSLLLNDLQFNHLLLQNCDSDQKSFFQIWFLEDIFTKCWIDRSNRFSVWCPLCCQGYFSTTLIFSFTFLCVTLSTGETCLMQDVVDPVTDEMLAKFVVDSHFKSQPKGTNVEDKSLSNSQDDIQPSARPLDPEVPILGSYPVSHSVACKSA